MPSMPTILARPRKAGSRQNSECGINGWFTTTDRLPKCALGQTVELSARPQFVWRSAALRAPRISRADSQPDDEINVTDLLTVIANWNQTGDGTFAPRATPLPGQHCRSMSRTSSPSSALGFSGCWRSRPPALLLRQ